MFFDSDALKSWFIREKRSFPWRGHPSPYEVWVSEVMLQQTQANVVVPYFTKWMKHFPTITALAHAGRDEVIKMWEGLGYYSRARNLHAGACYVVKFHQGNLPQDPEALSKIPGIGPYTQGAILSFAFHKKAAAVDGNVLRVLARYFSIEEEIEGAKKKIQALTLELLPRHEPWVVMEALIELGAQICRKTPLCSHCPLRGSCLGSMHQKAHLLPFKKKREKITFLERSVLIIIAEKKVLVGRVNQKKVMADLFEFPYVLSKEKKAMDELLLGWGLNATFCTELEQVEHSFTRFRARLFPSIWQAEKEVPVEDYDWIPWENLVKLPFSAGHRRIIEMVQNAHITH